MRALFCFVVTAGIVAACGDSPAASRRLRVATLAIVAQPAGSLAVTTNVGAFSVRATDSSGVPVPGALVNFILARGSGRVTPLADTTDATGIAETSVILGTAPGPHTVRAATRDLPPVESGIVTGIAGATARVTLSTSLATLSATQDSAVVGAAAFDAFGNGKSAAITWVSQNPASATVTAGVPGTTATLRVQSRPSETWVVASAGTGKDSVLVRALDASSSPCAFIATPTQLAIGAALPFETSGNACLNNAAAAEYLVIAHYGTTVNTVIATVNLVGTGITPASVTYPTLNAVAEPIEMAFERDLRDKERLWTPSYVDGARAWQRSLPVASIRASLTEGDQATVNTNPLEFCTNPTGTLVRVAAITQNAIVLHDMENPAGGFTDAEYRAFGTAFDTLVHPVDTAAFGVPSDIDGNGRVVILFTRAVNALTPRGSQSAVLGFFFSRDLLPQSGPFGSCPGSNVGEMFYVMVPDPAGVVSDARTKGFVDTIVPSTIAHEYQHLINTSRRIYVNGAPDSNEERWLNEGLSHIAEELVFYRASKLSPRQNIDSATLKTSGQLPTLLLHQQGNLRRYQQYLRAPDTNAPMAENDQLATRGAAWAFLRYAADRSRASDGDFWKRLVNSRSTGARNLEAVLSGSGFTVAQLLEEWSRAVVTDDIVPGSTAQQPSWSFVTAMPYAGFAFALAPLPLVNRTALTAPVRGSSSFYGRIAVPAGQEALLQATGPGGGTIPRGMRLTIVRIK